MAKWFIIIIYLAFISLGLPDAILGAAWPSMRLDLHRELGSVGIISMVIAVGTILSSMNAGKLIQKIGTGKLTLISCILTASALLGFSMSSSFMVMVILAVPLGLGAGAVDSSLNHYVADNYEAHHMNWLHSFWGVGATAGPLVIAYFIAKNNSWRDGYTAIALAQFFLVLVLFGTLSMWKKIAIIHKAKKEAANQANHKMESAEVNVFKIKGVKYTLLTFFFYCAAEASLGLWGVSYLVTHRGLAVAVAARWIALYFGGITLGRIVTGFITMKVDNRHLILYGQMVSILGALLILLPLPIVFTQIGLISIGLGLAPIFPGLMHETPNRFGQAHSVKLIGYQMAMAYTGTTFFPLIFGMLAMKFGIHLLPFVALVLLICMLICSERVHAVIETVYVQRDSQDAYKVK